MKAGAAMRSSGFTLAELLVAMAISLVVVGAALTMTNAARTALDVDPARLDATRRLRAGVESVAGAMRGAGSTPGVGTALAALEHAVPRVWPLAALDGSLAGPRFEAIWVIQPIETGAARLALDQPGASASLTLDPSPPCPSTPGVCGFTEEDVAVVFDERGHVDVFEVGAVSSSLMRLTPSAPLSYSHRSGAWVVKVRADRLGLVEESDGSKSLVRLTWRGAREPLADGVVSLELSAWADRAPPGLADTDDGPGLSAYGLPPPRAGEVDPDGRWPDGEHCMVRRAASVPSSRLAPLDAGVGLARLAPDELSDGPWCPEALSPGAFDADLFRIRRIDVRVRVESTLPWLRGPAGDLFARAGTATSPVRWVPDREFTVAIAVRQW